MMYRLLLLLAVCILIITPSTDTAELNYKPGAGMALTVDDAKLRLLGYIQPTFTFHGESPDSTISNEFFVRRARLDFIFDYKDDYQLFVELDARGSRTEMVLAQGAVRYLGKQWLMVGKFITPFSPENTRSSRSLTTIERYNALNSMFLLPGLDTQYGIMLYGQLNKLAYHFSVTNGNGKASQNLRENNDSKDVQLRLDAHFSDALKLSLAGNYSDEATQELKLVDHTFAPFANATVSGERFGYLGQVEFRKERFLLRAEGFRFHFTDDLSPFNQVEMFSGGYGEIGYFLTGNRLTGYQLIGRVESAGYGGDSWEVEDGTTRITSLLLGHNWYRDGIFRHQVNVTYEIADNPSQLPSSRFTGADDAITLLMMLQLKF